MNTVNVKIVNFQENWTKFEALKKEYQAPHQFLERMEKVTSNAILKSSWAGMLLLLHTLEEQGLSNLMAQYCLEAKGKPFFTSGKIHFNLTHSREYVALAWSEEMPVGIDIQEARKVYPGVIQKIMHPKELEHPQLNELDFFYERWTQKEAIVKMTGEGICVGMHKINTLAQFGAYDTHQYHTQKINIAPNYYGAIAAPKKFEINQHEMIFE